ncbi:hypothetical protein [Georgenia yuyongxinii]|uniref:Tight adherence protein B n=1 Tax=Georgenia yuyongxinii TaxID=2589797 RepID=A0A552WJ21_9MICO|nr:hypothetical protein [Georgenia yuyongxinii]TRW42760.1 hypothetical protein FJ693_20270 [Georgenia yuyongxinii]
MTAPAVVAVLVATATWLLLAPARTSRSRMRGPGVAAGRWRVCPGSRHPARPDLDLGVLVTEVATRLRTGVTVEKAWAETFARMGLEERDRAGPVLGDGGVPLTLERLALTSSRARTRAPTPSRTRAVSSSRRDLIAPLSGRAGGRGRRWRVTGRTRPGLSTAALAALPGALAACRLTHELGAPLAQVLERCAQGLTEAGHARTARAVALAGPRATARLLGWLPLLGLGLGIAVGADPLAVLSDGRGGTACLVLGLALMVAGRRWVAALDRAASSAADLGGAR